MQPRLKEQPKEWVKFTAVMAVLVSVLSWLLYRPVFPTVLILGLVTMLICVARPRWFRGFYRGGMTVSFHVGQFMGRILLTVLFLLVVTPMGLLLRLFGKDLLRLKRPEADSYWHPAKNANQFDRMF